jgi:hypothetical protein
MALVVPPGRKLCPMCKGLKREGQYYTDPPCGLCSGHGHIAEEEKGEFTRAEDVAVPRLQEADCLGGDDGERGGEEDPPGPVGPGVQDRAHREREDGGGEGQVSYGVPFQDVPEREPVQQKGTGESDGVVEKIANHRVKGSFIEEFDPETGICSIYGPGLPLNGWHGGYEDSEEHDFIFLEHLSNVFEHGRVLGKGEMTLELTRERDRSDVLFEKVVQVRNLIRDNTPFKHEDLDAVIKTCNRGQATSGFKIALMALREITRLGPMVNLPTDTERLDKALDIADRALHSIGFGNIFSRARAIEHIKTGNPT